MISEREKVEFESLPEFVRESHKHESRRASRDSHVPKTLHFRETDGLSSKSAELETLWPGVNHDFPHSPRKSPSFYLTIGFMTGIVVSLASAWAYFLLTHLPQSPPQAKKIIIASHKKGTVAANMRSNISTGNAIVTTKTLPASEPEIIAPLFNTYEVQEGDTLAGIAFKAYKRATPRLLDEICQANGLRNANMLNLGQQIQLPEYHLHPKQVAAESSISVQ